MLEVQKRRLVRVTLAVMVFGIINILLALLLEYTLTEGSHTFKVAEYVYACSHLVTGILIILILIMHEIVTPDVLFNTEYSNLTRFILGALIVAAAVFSLVTFAEIQLDQETLLWIPYNQVGLAILYWVVGVIA